MANNAITERDKDFAKWYTDVVRAAKLCDYSSVKGCMVIELMVMLFGKICKEY